MAYTEIDDYVLEQVWGYQIVNALKSNLDYLENKVFGNPSQNNHHIPSLSFDNDSSDGGTIYFDGGTASYIQCDALGNNLNINKNINMQGDKIIKGQRGTIVLAADTSYTTSAKNVNGAVLFSASRAGSLLSHSVSYQIEGSPGSTFPFLDSWSIDLYKNGSLWLGIVNPFFTNNGYNNTKIVYGSRETHQFAKGDVFHCRYGFNENYGPGDPEVFANVLLEVMYDA